MSGNDGDQAGGAPADKAISAARTIGDLPREFYGRLTLIYEAGRVQRVEVHQSLRPQLADRALDKGQGRA